MPTAAPPFLPLAQVRVNWCADLGTVLSNEEVIDGKSERGDFPVVRMPLRQWVLKITALADRLAAELDGRAGPKVRAVVERRHHLAGLAAVGSTGQRGR